MPHIHEKIDFTAEVFIVHKDKVLLRKHDKYHVWLAVGGHIELHEDPNQAAVREVKEEIGLDVELYDDLLTFDGKVDEYKELIPPKFLNIHNISDTHKHIAMSYFAKSETDKITEILGDEKADSIKWFSMEELERNEEGIREDIIFYAKRALLELGEKENE